MNIISYIKSIEAFNSLNDVRIQKVIIDRGLTSTEDYTKEKQKQVDLIVADLYVELSSNPDFSEGDLSIRYDRKHLMILAANLYDKHGVEYPFKRTSSVITSGDNLW